MRQSIILPALLQREAAIQRISKLLAALPLNRPFRIDIDDHKPRRSLQQNRYLFGCVYPTIQKLLAGWEVSDIHDYFLGEWAGWETLEGFGKKRLRPLKRSSRLNKQEFSDFVAFIQRRAAEHGVFIPDADPSYWEHAA